MFYHKLAGYPNKLKAVKCWFQQLDGFFVGMLGMSNV